MTIGGFGVGDFVGVARGRPDAAGGKKPAISAADNKVAPSVKIDRPALNERRGGTAGSTVHTRVHLLGSVLLGRISGTL